MIFKEEDDNGRERVTERHKWMCKQKLSACSARAALFWIPNSENGRADRDCNGKLTIYLPVTIAALKSWPPLQAAKSRYVACIRA